MDTMNFYMITETNFELGQVPELWSRKFDTQEQAIDEVIAYLKQTEQLYGRENDIEGIKCDLRESGYVHFFDENICFVVHQVSL